MQKRVTILVALAAALLVIILAAYFSSSSKIASQMQENVSERLHEIVEPNVISFRMQIKEQMKKVNTIADYLGSAGELGDASQIELLRAAVRNNGLLRCAIAFPDGSFVTHDGKNEGNVSTDDFFLANMRGEFFISDPRPAVVDATKMVMLFSAPIRRDGEIIGSIIYSYPCDEMNAVFNLSFMDGNGALLVIDADGNLLISGDLQAANGVNVLDYMRTNCTHAMHKPEDCLILTQASGGAVETLPDMEPLIIHYERLGYNDWYTLAVVEESAAARFVDSVSREQRNLGIIVAACILLYCVVALVLWLRQFQNVDKLTGALTLESFKRHAKRILRRRRGAPFVFIKLDVKNFKLINRIYDFTEGDRVIKNIAAALRAVLCEPDMLFARAGTDDFLLLLPYIDRDYLSGQRTAFIAKFRELMGSHFSMAVEFPTGQYLLSKSDYPHPDIPEILEKVNFAHRAAKQYGYTAIVDYVETLEHTAIFHKTIEDRMESALEHGEFQMYLQPKHDVRTGQICGAEALVRWMVNGEFYLPPVDFIPVLESNGFVVKLDLYMFRCAVKKISAQLHAGEAPVTISVNFARCHLSNERFVQDLCAIADEYEVPHHFLEIELTETAAFEQVERMVALIDQLHAADFSISMDDFGTGFSSLSLLKDLEVDTLKIDRGFFDDAANPLRARIILANMICMAKQLHIQTVAEGVEVPEQVEMLRALGCDLIQGYYYSRPMPADSFCVREAPREEMLQPV